MKVRLGKISYRNVMPVYWGFDQGGLPPFLEITAAPPSTLNAMIGSDTLDISPVSSLSYARYFNHWLILPGLSIASKGRIMSVLLLSRVSLDRLSGSRILVSSESETSVELLKLCLQREGVTPLFEQDKITASMLIDHSISGILVIGDLALKWGLENIMPYKTDLGLYWQDWTDEPFVFALWAVRKQFAEDHPDLVSKTILSLQDSLKTGLASLSAVSKKAGRELGIKENIMMAYFKGLSYHMEAGHEQGLRYFFRLLKENGYIDGPVPLRFFEC